MAEIFLTRLAVRHLYKNTHRHTYTNLDFELPLGLLAIVEQLLFVLRTHSIHTWISSSLRACSLLLRRFCSSIMYCEFLRWIASISLTVHVCMYIHVTS